MTCASNEDSDQPGHLHSLITVFAVRSKKRQGPKVSSCGLPDWADAQADLSLSWAHRSFCWFCHAAAQFYNIIWEIEKIPDRDIRISHGSVQSRNTAHILVTKQQGIPRYVLSSMKTFTDADVDIEEEQTIAA